MKLNVDVSLYLSSTTSSPIYGKIKELKFEKGLFGGVCCCLLVVCGCLLVVCGGLLLVCCSLLLVCGRLLVRYSHLWWMVVFACFSNYAV